jgi:5-methylcytosine-specific restriction endonuclease McrA
MYPRSIHLKLFQNQDGKCFYCKEQMVLARPSVHPLRACTLDHKIARCNGGSNTEENLVAACAECNGMKGHLSDKAFMDFLQKAQNRHHLHVLCKTAMYPNCKTARRMGSSPHQKRWVNGNFPSRKESLLDRAWRNILESRNEKEVGLNSTG